MLAVLAEDSEDSVLGMVFVQVRPTWSSNEVYQLGKERKGPESKKGRVRDEETDQKTARPPLR
jgi:hypothetical protein